jgi:FtsP/CotA-like multicopper oxidase with cupredoxin domain
MKNLSRRSLLQLTAFSAAGTGLLASRSAVSGPQQGHAAAHPAGHLMGAVGRVAPGVFSPTSFLRSWNFSELPPDRRAKYYHETLRADGTRLREYQLVAIDREIEIAPGVFFPAWTYNGQVPGPTIRATEGDRIRVTFLNQGSHPHTIHFHGWHLPAMDGSLPEHEVKPGDRFVYEFDAEPFGMHLYHCHAAPLKRHIHKGLYGVFIVDPKTPRPPADELIMVMNGFDTNFDADNEVYAVNTIAHHFMHEPIDVEVGRLTRMYVVNLTEFDLVNSLHLHGMFFDVFRTGTALAPSESTDTIMLCQGERAILETRFRYPGQFMFHAHQSEFAELGWMGMFQAREARRDS